jgi:hypothetical protein
MSNEKKETKMSPNTQKKLFFSTLFLFLPLIVFAQSNRGQSVALIPFWGPDEQLIREFGEELYNGVNNLQGFRSINIDMTNLPEDVPEGGFPPYISPAPSLVKTNPLAITGEITADPDDDEWWHLRLYLWEMIPEPRLVFSDQLTAYDREECAAALPGMLDWLFGWLKKGGKGTGVGEGEGGDTTNIGGARETFRNTAMPLHWMYVGVRGGLSPLRMQTAPTEFSFKPNEDPDWGKWEGVDLDKFNKHVLNEWQTYNVALSFNIAFFPDSVPFFSRFGLQVEGVFKWDTNPIETMTIVPGALLKFQAYREGDLLISLFGGAYTPILPLGETEKLIRYSEKFPVGWTVGGSFGSRLEGIPGVFFIDIRWSQDLFNTYVLADDEGYKRRELAISVGYEFGFVRKR